MHATIRCYEGVTGTTEELIHAVRHLAAKLSGAPGFVSFVVLEADSGDLVAVSVFEDQISLKAADRKVWPDLSDQIALLLPENPQVITGEIVFQRGL